MVRTSVLGAITACLAAASASPILDLVTRQSSASCPGYKASNVKQTDNSLSADLTLAGPACNIYGTDLTNLVLNVEYETSTFTEGTARTTQYEMAGCGELTWSSR